MRPKVATFFLLFLISCQSHRLDVDISDIKIEKISINRLEKDLFETPPDSLSSQKLYKKYGIFYLRFIRNIINPGDVRDSLSIQNLARFIKDRDMHNAYVACQQKYPDFANFESQLTIAFKHFNYYFPKRNIPKVVTFMSGFNYSIVNIDSVLGIGLEMYLGSDNEFYKMIQFPKFKTISMRNEYMLPDCIRGWMTTEFKKNYGKNDFLGQIIHAGKIMYLVDAILPEVDDTLKMAYTYKQLQWCQHNEFNVWSHFIQQKLLYSNDNSEIMKYTSEGPFTSVFNKESPSRVGNWVGWQIIRAYMNKNPEITLQQLIDESDAQKILTKSKYKPSK